MNDMHFDLPVLGLEVKNLHLIESAIYSPFTELPPDMTVNNRIGSALPEWLSGSIMPDGTLYGVIHIDHRRFPFLEERERFKLH